MSFNGIVQFEKNLRTMMDSDAFKKADDGERLRLGGTLMRSSYGARAISQPKELVDDQESKAVEKP